MSNLKGENFAKDINVPTNVSGNVGSNVGSELDGKPLTNGEKALIKAIRRAKVGDIFSYRKTTIVYYWLGRLLHDEVHIAFRTLGSDDQNKDILEALVQIEVEQEAEDGE